MADLYTFELFGGGTLTYCSGDQSVVANGVFYPATIGDVRGR